MISYIDSDGLTATETAVTDKNGEILFKSVDSGVEYTITEQPQQGYEQQPPQKVTPKPGETATVKFHNVPSTKITTTAVDKITDDHYAYISKNTTIVDTVAYSNVVIGRTYTLKGRIHFRDGTKTAVTAYKTFVAEDTNGTVDVEFNFDSTAFANKSVVIFEELYYNDIKITDHADVNDDNQTVNYLTPAVHTTAVDKATGEHTGYASAEPTTIIDTVAMTGLIIGKEYTVEGILMDKSTGDKLIVNDKNVTAEKRFTATAEEMIVDMEFVFDSSDLGDITVVVFESLKYNDIEIAYHKDINDDNQTVTIHGNGDIRFIKTDENDNPISNVKFNIYNDVDCTIPATRADGSNIDTVTTGKDGLVEYTDMLYGTYYIAETQTVNGKQLLTGVITANVTKDGTSLTYNGKELEMKEIVGSNEQIPVVENVEIPELPRTGGVGVWSTTAVALLLLSAGGTVMFNKRKKFPVKLN